MALFGFRANSSLIWGGGEDGGLLFHFILSKIVAITVLEMLLMILKNITVIGVFVLGYVFQNE